MVGGLGSGVGVRERAFYGAGEWCCEQHGGDLGCESEGGESGMRNLRSCKDGSALVDGLFR